MRLRAHPGSNFIYADAAGNILYIWNAAIPARPRVARELRMPGEESTVPPPSLNDAGPDRADTPAPRDFSTSPPVVDWGVPSVAALSWDG